MDGTGAAATFVCCSLRALPETGRVRPPPGKRATFLILDSDAVFPVIEARKRRSAARPEAGVRAGRPRVEARAPSSAWHLTCAKVRAWESPPLCARATRVAVTQAGHAQGSITSNN